MMYTMRIVLETLLKAELSTLRRPGISVASVYFLAFFTGEAFRWKILQSYIDMISDDEM